MSSFTTFMMMALSAALILTNSKASAAPSPDLYQLVNSYTGKSFFNGWSFWDQPDPTNGFVNYTSKQVAMDANLAGYIYNQANAETTAFMGVDATTLNPTAGRASVRISSEQTWSQGGLFVADVRHTPQGACGSWPALWLVGPDWPNQGEIDIIEGVNDDQFNSMTLHTGPGCSSNLAPGKFLGKQVTNDCDVSSGENTGCSIRANFSQSVKPGNKKQMLTHPAAGHAFNAAGGGVYATLWDASGIKIWMFAHSAIPADIVSGKPDPSTWTVKPVAQFGGDGCDYSNTFKNQQLVIDTTFCGDWAGAPEVWDASAACKAKAPTCEEFVAYNPEAFKDAYWDIASIHVYQTGEQMAASGTSVVAGNGNGKRDFPATLGEIMPEPEEGDEADCAHMVGTSGANMTMPAPPYPMGNSTSANSTAPSNSTTTYGNSSTNYTAAMANVRREGRFARFQ